MEWISLASIVSHLIATVIAFISGWIFTKTHDRVRRQREHKGQRALLSGLQNPTIFVYPPRPRNDNEPNVILPNVISTEDFLAINNVISAFLRVGWEPPKKIKDTDPEHLTDDDKRHNNLILICSSKTNYVTRDALCKLRETYPHLKDVLPAFELVNDSIAKTCRVLLHCKGATYYPPSYGQPIKEGSLIKDYAIIAKTINPWSPAHRLLIVAGLRGIGTWGAAEALKKSWQEMYEKKGDDRNKGTSKGGNFVAVLRVHYQDEDIKSPDLLNMIDLDESDVVGRPT